jgi:serine/threonine protein phosphatase PrpC
MKGGVPNELIIQIPGNNNQDIVLTGVNYVIICDGHGAIANGPGRAIAQDVAQKCAQLIPENIEVNQQNLELLKNGFIKMVCDNFEGWRERFPKAGTTVLIVVFSKDYQSYMVVKLGDSYVLQIPQGLQQNASAYAFNSTEFEEGKYMPSMSPAKLFKNFTNNGIKSYGISKKFEELYGARISINPITQKFKLPIKAMEKPSDNVATLSIDPPFFKPDDDIRKFLENFTKYGIFQRNPEELLIIASDGLPIEDGSIWRIIHSKSALEQYFSNKPSHDDFTVVII